MKTLARVAFYRLDGVCEIRLVNKFADKIDLSIQWPDERWGVFMGYTLNGFLKYREI